MRAEQRCYIAIDLKSFYASVECVERGLDPLSTNLVVADPTRTDKTICLAVTPSLKAHGIPSRPRLFEVIAGVREVNAARRMRAPHRTLYSGTYDDKLLQERAELALDYIVAPPRMALYIDYSTRVLAVYLKYFSIDDIHVYSVDEAFIDITAYLKTYRTTPRELVMRVILDVLSTTGVTATAGIGTNLYLAKVAMDVVAKRIRPDENGVRIAELDEMSYRRLLWEHRPLTDFWRVGSGITRTLEKKGIYTMGDIALASIKNEELLYRLFGVNAELLIDHAWGRESCTMAEIKAYRPSSESVSTGQVLSCPYEYEKARLIVREMSELLALDLVERGIAANSLTLTVFYDAESIAEGYIGAIATDFYGREVPRHARGTVGLPEHSSSGKLIVSALVSLFEHIAEPSLKVRRIGITACGLVPESERERARGAEQMDMFTDEQTDCELRALRRAEYEREKRRQGAMISIKNKYGKNAIVHGMNLEEGGTTLDRNMQIGGHKA